MKTKLTNRQLIARAIWLAFKSSAPVGLGVLHIKAAQQQTEETLIAYIDPKEASDGSLTISTDYVFGRMIKTTFKCDAKGTLTIWPEEPRGQYQSWAPEFRTATELVGAVYQSLAG